METGVILFGLLSCMASLALITVGLVMSARKDKLRLLLVLLTGMGIVLSLFVPLLQKSGVRLTHPADPIQPLAIESSPIAETRAIQSPAVELEVAAATGLVQFTVTGNDLANINLTLHSTSDTPLEVVIPAGVIFVAESPDLQNMMVRTEQRVWLDSSDQEVSLTIPVACVNMERQVPTMSDKLSLSKSPVGNDLVKLLQLPNFQSQSFRVQQFAIWTITDNPSRAEYVGIGSFGVGSGPDDQEIQTIRNLFKQAGIQVDKYRALWPILVVMWDDMDNDYHLRIDEVLEE